ncbi:hypothetical protein, partial [Mycobacterium intracellulare]|uniref:hypothetical protein n=1 Tax=Mycobacterium intracellulare TaxID=1767 RepID=UPI00197BB74B
MAVSIGAIETATAWRSYRTAGIRTPAVAGGTVHRVPLGAAAQWVPPAVAVAQPVRPAPVPRAGPDLAA